MGHLLPHKGGESGDIETAGEGHRPVALLQREQTGVVPSHGSQGVAVLGIGEGLGKTYLGGAALGKQHHVTCSPCGSEQHGLGHIAHAIDIEETVVAVLLETVLGHPEELYLAVAAHLSVCGIAHLLPIAHQGGGAVEYHQLPWSVTKKALLAEEEGAKHAVVDKALPGLLFLEQVAQQHILRVVVPHQSFNPGHGKTHLPAIGHHLDGLAIVQVMTVGIAVVHPEIAERVAAKTFIAHLPCEGIALTFHGKEMPWHLVEAHARLTAHRQLGGGRHTEALERDDKPAMDAREHQQAECHEAERKADNDAIVLIHSIFGWYESVPPINGMAQGYGEQIYI